MAAKTFSPPVARRASAPAPAVVRAPAAVKPAVAPAGVPRFAAARAAASMVASAPRAAAPSPLAALPANVTPEPQTPSARATKTPPATRRVASTKPAVAPHARIARSESVWEREAATIPARLREPPRPAEKPRVGDAPNSGLQSAQAHPGVGPSPPPLAETESHPLPAALRTQLEARTGFDLRDVRVVTGPGAEITAARFHARAFTQFGRIHLGANSSPSDTSLLAHEAAHVLQQTLPAEQLARVGLTPAPPDMILRQLGGQNRFLDRQLARRSLKDPLSLPFWVLPSSLSRTLNWIGDEGLALRLTRAVPELMHPTLNPLRALEAGWMAAQAEAKLFTARKRYWDSILALALRTEDRSLAAAARHVASELPDVFGARWTRLKQLIEQTAAVGEFSARRWSGGLATLAPHLDEMIGALQPDITTTFAEFDQESWVTDALRTALGCPKHLQDAAAMIAWVNGVRDQANRLISGPAWAASNLKTAQHDTTVFARLAAQAPKARAIGGDLVGIAQIMEQPEGVILQRAKLATLLPRIGQQVPGLQFELNTPMSAFGHAFDHLGFNLQTWGGASVFTFFPNEFDWMQHAGVEFETWLSEKEPQLLDVTHDTLTGVDHWTGLVAETVAEADTLDASAPDYDMGWFLGPIKRLYAALSGAKEKFIAKLMEKVPLLKELRAEAADLWQKAQGHFAHFKERIFKEGRILAPVWEFFLNVLSLVVPTGFVRDIADRAGGMLGKILRHPIQFLKNLVKAIGKGFQRFGENIGNHLLNSLLEWLLGEFDLQPPVTFGKIVHALMERIGFTRATLCERIAEYLNRKGHSTTAAKVEARLERAIQIGATALRWLTLLFQGKFAEFWQEIKGHLGKLWQWVVDRAVRFVMDQLVKQLFKWIAKFFDPTGLMAALNAIKTLYHLIATAIRYAERMLEIVRQIFQAVREIAAGELDRAAFWVETAASRGLTVVVAFLARALDLGSVVDYFKKGLDEVKKLVVAGMDGLIKLTGELWEWLVAKAEQAKEWWNSRRKFKDADGATRELAYDTTGPSAVLYVSAPEATGQVVVQKTPQTLEEYLKSFVPNTDRERALHKEIKQRAAKIDKIKKDASGSFGTADGELIYAYFHEIVLLLNELSGRGPTPPATMVDWTAKNIWGDDYGRKMVAHPLSIDPGDNVGSKPVAGDTTLWTDVGKHLRGGASAYIQGHLLNHHLHGPGTWKNMVPLSRRTNTKMESIAEGAVKKAVLGQKRVVRYEVTMIFGTHSQTPRTQGEEELPSRIEMSAEELKYSRGKWVPTGVTILPATTLDHQLRDKND